MRARSVAILAAIAVASVLLCIFAPPGISQGITNWAINFTGSLAGDVTGTQGATVVGKIGGQTVTLANPFTTSGAFPLTLTTTASTNVTLPTAGTLTRYGGVLDHQGPLGVVAMDGTDKTLFTYTMPANTMGAGGCVFIYWSEYHSTGTTATLLKMFFGATAVNIQAATTDVTQYVQGSPVEICNNPGVTNAQQWFNPQITVVGSLLAWSGGVNPTSAIDTTQSVVIKLTANNATGTDRFTPLFWTVR